MTDKKTYSPAELELIYKVDVLTASDDGGILTPEHKW